jgi:predicted protein tyrosine phosphatase
MSQPLKLLFICTQNRMRSLTAEHMLNEVPGYAVKSAGIAPDATTRVNEGLIRWADRIFVMQEMHRLVMEENFPKAMKGKQVICLHIPDEYSYMEPALVATLKARLKDFIQLQ